MIQVEVDLSKFIPGFSEELAKQIGMADKLKRELTVGVREGIMDTAPYWSGKTKSTWYITPGMTPRSVPTTTKRDVYWPEASPNPDALPETPFDWPYTVQTTNEYAEDVNAGVFKREHAMFVERGMDLAVSEVSANYNKMVAEIRVSKPKPKILERVKNWFKGIFKR